MQAHTVLNLQIAVYTHTHTRTHFPKGRLMRADVVTLDV